MGWIKIKYLQRRLWKIKNKIYRVKNEKKQKKFKNCLYHRKRLKIRLRKKNKIKKMRQTVEFIGDKKNLKNLKFPGFIKYCEKKCNINSLNLISEVTKKDYPMQTGNTVLKYRQIVRKDFENSLNKALSEVKQENEDPKTYLSTFSSAIELENAMLDACGGFVGKEYREKYRLIMFNVNDPNNYEFRKSVCKGDISPSYLMSLREADIMSRNKKDKLEEIERETNKARVIDIERAALINTTVAEIYYEEIRKKKEIVENGISPFYHDESKKITTIKKHTIINQNGNSKGKSASIKPSS